jgi:hypothetical protein
VDEFDEPATIRMFYSQTLNFFILLLQLEKVAVAVCVCLAHAVMWLKRFQPLEIPVQTITDGLF